MATLAFTRNLERHLDVPSLEVPAGTLRSALECAFAANGRLRGYLLDDQGALREHVVVFVDGQRTRDRKHLSDLVAEHSEVYVMQALSGG